MTTPHGNKRKRGGGESGVSRPSPALRSGAALPQDVSSEMEHYDEGALSQLIAHNNGNHEHHQNGGESNATDTAAAALNHYQMGAATTAYETPSTGGDDSSLSLNVNPGASFSDAFLKAGPGPVDDMPGGLRGAGKPPVGSEEWHKIRRDNHKEGKFPTYILICLASNTSKLSAVDAKPSTKALTNLPRLSQTAKRTRARSCSAPSSTLVSSRRTRRKTSRSGRSRSFCWTKPSRSSAPLPSA